MKDEAIIQKAVEQLKKLLNHPVQWKEKGLLDGKVNLEYDGDRLTFTGVVKKEIRSYHFPELENYKETHGPFILIADTLYPKQRKTLRAIGINYVDSHGNVYIRKGPVLILADRPTKQKAEKETGNRAFTPTGLKVVLQLLMDKELINATQRTIADKANVALGNIPQVIAGLKETNYLIALNKKEYLWKNRKELLERWIKEYEITLIPKIQKGRYRLEGNWRNLQLKENDAWGGEAAGELLTQYLRAENLILYAKATRNELMSQYRFIPDEKGKVFVREKFWTDNHQEQNAPPILVYADLVLANNQRCLDTAQIIFDEYIERAL